MHVDIVVMRHVSLCSQPEECVGQRHDAAGRPVRDMPWYQAHVSSPNTQTAVLSAPAVQSGRLCNRSSQSSQRARTAASPASQTPATTRFRLLQRRFLNSGHDPFWRNVLVATHSRHAVSIVQEQPPANRNAPTLWNALTTLRGAEVCAGAAENVDGTLHPCIRHKPGRHRSSAKLLIPFRRRPEIVDGSACLHSTAFASGFLTLQDVGPSLWRAECLSLLEPEPALSTCATPPQHEYKGSS
ncbi:uncharacterized protein M421DRAFT_92393 [Didymella exigua CBS 183.55]|uniref:Uncharacterized protein n=1 Tax=Didymella exigua CBS 183.55 TaxID=1150837 RepID=A0A6A5RJZ9_9PLEO|nr:uncharacterized protein M421DRAFT_92393 [Didymella exigua CBS 183.55]KAF1928695.1 hypothetical protein M421DRAFT_92393 [Didymella exigua CBS 183.55]